MSGVVHGGWEYVWAAYVITAVVIFGYAGSVWARYRTERERT